MVLLLCYCLTRPKDAYLPQFDETEEKRQREWETKMKLKYEKMYGRKLSASSLDAAYIYNHGKDVDLPPAVQDAR